MASHWARALRELEDEDDGVIDIPESPPAKPLDRRSLPSPDPWERVRETPLPFPTDDDDDEDAYVVPSPREEEEEDDDDPLQHSNRPKRPEPNPFRLSPSPESAFRRYDSQQSRPEPNSFRLRASSFRSEQSQAPPNSFRSRSSPFRLSVPQSRPRSLRNSMPPPLEAVVKSEYQTDCIGPGLDWAALRQPGTRQMYQRANETERRKYEQTHPNSPGGYKPLTPREFFGTGRKR